MLQSITKYFQLYSDNVAPFMHKQFAEWQKTRPLQGLRVLHHVPLVPNTLLKVACVVAAGTEVVVTNPSFCQHSQKQLLLCKKIK